MGMSGSAPPQQQAPDPMIQIREDNARREREQQAQQAAAAKRTVDVQNWNTTRGQQQASAATRIMGDISRQGIQGYDANDASNPLFNQVNDELSRISGTIGELDPNSASYFSGDIGQMIMDRERDTQRSAYGRQIDSIAPFNFAKSGLSDTADDSILSSILGEQFTGATEQAQRAFDRGNLNQQGFQSAQNLIGSANTAGNAKFQQIGQGVLSGDRDRLREEADTYRTRASNFELGQQFDPSALQGSLDSLRTEQAGTLEGRIRGAIGGENAFDSPGILNSAGIKQGVFNPAGAGAGAGQEGSLLSALEERKKDSSTGRGVGSQGVF
tara:strand:- start:1986 stop:2966 length:981 start_codon:yes stop_codon:yes gene_type:complete